MHDNDKEWDVADESWGHIGLPESAIPVDPDFDQLGDVCHKWAPRLVKLQNQEVAELHLRCFLTEALQVLLITSTSTLAQQSVDALTKSNADFLAGYKGGADV